MRDGDDTKVPTPNAGPPGSAGDPVMPARSAAQRGEWTQVRDLLERWPGAADHSEGSTLLAEAYLRLGLPDRARLWLERVIPILERRADRAPLRRCVNMLGIAATELGDLADNYAEFQRLGVEIYAVSTDTHFTHKAWHDTSDTIGKIEYFMVGDPTGAVTRNFDVMREEQGLADRGAFVIDPDGVIQVVEVTAEGVGRNAVELLRKVRAAQYVRKHPGEVCPAKWDEGDETLAPSLDLVGKI